MRYGSVVTSQRYIYEKYVLDGEPIEDYEPELMPGGRPPSFHFRSGP
jgi:hypothetical protein